VCVRVKIHISEFGARVQETSSGPLSESLSETLWATLPVSHSQGLPVSTQLRPPVQSKWNKTERFRSKMERPFVPPPLSHLNHNHHRNFNLSVRHAIRSRQTSRQVDASLTPMTSTIPNDSNGPNGLTGAAGGAQGAFVGNLVGNSPRLPVPKSQGLRATQDDSTPLRTHPRQSTQDYQVLTGSNTLPMNATNSLGFSNPNLKSKI
jgi:hypothetical protein